MIPSVLARQLQHGLVDYFRTTYPFANEPFRSSVAELKDDGISFFHEPYTTVSLPFREAEEVPDVFEAVRPAFTPYVHQAKAWERLSGEDGQSTVVATGTGSGKTECFLYPILEYCYQHKDTRGVKALIIYPMNALASDQATRMARLIWRNDKLKGNVTVGLYVGGQKGGHGSMVMSEDGVITDRETMQANPPDILLTNYKMLDYLLVRPTDAHIWDCDGYSPLKYVAVDELHTFDGAQGTDLACLIRRLKTRLRIPAGSLCCVGTSATIGGESSVEGVRKYASDVFGEPFSERSIIVEDRLTVEQFLSDSDAFDDPVMDDETCSRLASLVEANDVEGYLHVALDAMCDSLVGQDVRDPDVRVRLSSALLGNTLFRDLIEVSGGRPFQATKVAGDLSVRHVWLNDLEHPDIAVDALVALISHARTGTATSMSPFLTVQVQLWERELARLVSEVAPDRTRFEISINVGAGEKRKYLPVHNCGDCGRTAWVSLIDSNLDLSDSNLDAFYSAYFGDGENIVSLYPREIDDPEAQGLRSGWLCPSCLHVHLDTNRRERVQDHRCENCGTDCIPIFLSELESSGRKGTGSLQHHQYTCPFCGSETGLTLMGMRNTSEAEVALSQMFASAFDDDHKSLVFSDSVQDASHRAGFFNGRTWRFGLRTAMAEWLENGGGEMTFADFSRGFSSYFQERMSPEEFVARFLAPNNLWMREYERMVETGSLSGGEETGKILYNVTSRMRYECVLEFGLRRRMGRTLERSGVATVTYDRQTLREAVSVAKELIRNREGYELEQGQLEILLQLMLDRLRSNGAIADEALDEYVLHGGNTYFLSKSRRLYMPGLSATNIPHMLLQRGSKNNYISVEEGVFDDIAEKCFPSRLGHRQIVQALVDGCVKAGLLVELEAGTRNACLALSKDSMVVTNDVRRLTCTRCGATFTFARSVLGEMGTFPCPSNGCDGHLELSGSDHVDYYGGLFGGGLNKRVRASEHTGLLERSEREELEREFKADESIAKSWYPNVLSCTPTLEMGIDIGSLSSLILCGMPRGQSEFLQRVGRAGRRDGNAFCLVLADATPRGMYYYGEPKEMISGDVEPPRVFLQAASVLERQLVAFCMDSWIVMMRDQAIVPHKVRECLTVMPEGKQDASRFPFNFLNYVKSNKRMLLGTFLSMFKDDIADDPQATQALRSFIMGNDGGEEFASAPFYLRMLEVFQDRYELRKSYFDQRDTLNKAIAELKAKPKDKSFEDQIKERNYELRAVVDVIKGIENEDVYGLLTREGMLPNYAFPEDGVNLRTVVRRKSEETEDDEHRWKRTTREYARSAAAAITDLAPRNTFYAGGRHFTIDQIDLSTSKEELWRLCPNCSHMERVMPDTAASYCVKCGSPAWADAGQLHKMIRLKTVVSNVDDIDSRTDDSSDTRKRAYFVDQLLVDVDSDDVLAAYHVSNESTGLDFGFEYAREATLRQVNFGQSGQTVGRQTYVAGQERVRPGFRYCTKCGKVEEDVRGSIQIRHTYACPVTTGAVKEEDVIEESLFLYREFKSEALRLLIPETSFVSDERSILDTFVATIMLGLHERFGNVDHINATISDEPLEQGSGIRKQFLVLFDSVPGGTGYLKQLASNSHALMEVLNLARDKLLSCSCAEDPEKDGCYHCLLAYRTTRRMGSLSRRRAIEILNDILNPDNKMETIASVSNIKPNNLLESELEHMFVDALTKVKGPSGEKATVKTELVHDKKGYELRVGDVVWDVEPQVSLGPDDGVSIQCKPDFVLWPHVRRGEESPWRPVAVFTDGFAYHKGEVDDDSAKREAIRRSEAFRVWSLSYKDVEYALDKSSGDYYLDCLKIPELPSEKFYNRYLSTRKPTGLVPNKLAPFDMLCWYLTHENAEQAFADQASAYSMGMLGRTRDKRVFDRDNAVVDDISSSLFGETITLEFNRDALMRWTPSENDHLAIYSGATLEDLRANKVTLVYAELDDTQPEAKGFQRNWNGFLDLFNVMQFSDSFRAVTELGLLNGKYESLTNATKDVAPEAGAPQSEAWEEIVELLFDDESKEFTKRLASLGVPVPDEAGYEDDDEAMAELVWFGPKVCYLIEEQAEDAGHFIEQGYRIIDPSMDDATILETLC